VAGAPLRVLTTDSFHYVGYALVRALPGLVGAAPLEDLLALKRYLRPQGPGLPENPELSRARVLGSYLRTYAGRPPTADVFWSALLRDPAAVVGFYRRTRADAAIANVTSSRSGRCRRAGLGERAAAASRRESCSPIRSIDSTSSRSTI
jgi:hypothetical protein